MKADAQDDVLSPWFVAIVALFVTSLITANIVAVKIVDINGVVVPAGTVTLFPLSYIIGDVLTEVYGFRRARMVIWLGFVCNLIAVAAIYMTPATAGGEFLGWSASLRAHPWLRPASAPRLVCSLSRRGVCQRDRTGTAKDRHPWALVWTQPSARRSWRQGCDSVIFIGIAFVGTVTTHELLRTMPTAWLA